MNANTTNHEDQSEAVVLLALTTLEKANKERLPILSKVTLVGPSGASDVRGNGEGASRDYQGAQGAPELLNAIHESQKTKQRRSYHESGGPFAGREVFVDPLGVIATEPIPESAPVATRSHAYV